MAGQVSELAPLSTALVLGSCQMIHRLPNALADAQLPPSQLTISPPAGSNVRAAFLVAAVSMAASVAAVHAGKAQFAKETGLNVPS